MATTPQEKPLPSPPPPASPPRRFKSIPRTLLVVFLLFASICLLVPYYPIYLRSTNASLTGIIALPTLILFLTARLADVVFKPRGVWTAFFARQTCYHLILTPFWIHNINKATDTALLGLVLARQAAELAVMEKDDDMVVHWGGGRTDTVAVAMETVRRSLIQWEVASGFRGEAYRLARWCVDMPGLMNVGFWALIVLSSALVVFVIREALLAVATVWRQAQNNAAWKKTEEEREKKERAEAVRVVEEAELKEAMEKSVV